MKAIERGNRMKWLRSLAVVGVAGLVVALGVNHFIKWRVQAGWVSAATRLVVSEPLSVCVSQRSGEALETLGVQSFRPDEMAAFGTYILTMRKPGTLRPRDTVLMETKFGIYELRKVGPRAYQVRVEPEAAHAAAGDSEGMCMAIVIHSVKLGFRPEAQ